MRSTFIALLIAAGLAVMAGVALSRQAAAQEARHDEPCDDGTLRGQYGVLVTGVRAIGPASTEQFVAVGVRTFDGTGQFTDVASFHGAVLPAFRGGHVSGTYHVNPDCTGTSIFQLRAPFPTIESDFVIVDHGRRINEAVMSPQPNIVTAVYQRKWRRGLAPVRHRFAPSPVRARRSGRGRRQARASARGDPLEPTPASVDDKSSRGTHMRLIRIASIALVFLALSLSTIAQCHEQIIDLD